jgi:glucokinase
MTGVVFDIGGTQLRAGLFDPKRGLRAKTILKKPTPNTVLFPRFRPEDLQRRLLHDVESFFHSLAAGDRVSWFSVAIAGPVTREGVVHRAPSLWGASQRPLALRRVLEKRLGVPGHVMNDVTAAAAFFAHEPRYRSFRRFGVLTVSTGLGLKIYDRDQNDCLISPTGLGGEIGHLPLGGWGEGFSCSCGKKGHINGISSGRGAPALIRFLAKKHPLLFHRSSLRRMATLESAPFAENAIRCLREHPQEDFSKMFLDHATAPLANLLHALTLSLGLERFILMGGVALSFGSAYRAALLKHLQRAGIYGRSRRQIDRLIDLAPRRDDFGLWGAGFLGSANAGKT